MADVVLNYVNQQNRPFNAQNIADALGRHGIKKGLAQKHLDTLLNDGKINCKDAGKQKVYFALQTGEVMTPEQVAEAEATIKVRTQELSQARAENQRRHAKLAALAKQLTVKQMKARRGQAKGAVTWGKGGGGTCKQHVLTHVSAQKLRLRAHQ